MASRAQCNQRSTVWHQSVLSPKAIFCYWLDPNSNLPFCYRDCFSNATRLVFFLLVFLPPLERSKDLRQHDGLCGTTSFPLRWRTIFWCLSWVGTIGHLDYKKASLEGYDKCNFKTHWYWETKRNNRISDCSFSSYYFLVFPNGFLPLFRYVYVGDCYFFPLVLSVIY